jgi:hypothetical protein
MSGDTKHVAYNFGPYEYDPLTLDRKVYNFKDNTELRVRKYGNLYKFSFPKYSRELTINTPPPQGGATIAPEETLGTDVDWCGNILQST